MSRVRGRGLALLQAIKEKQLQVPSEPVAVDQIAVLAESLKERKKALDQADSGSQKSKIRSRIDTLRSRGGLTTDNSEFGSDNSSRIQNRHVGRQDEKLSGKTLPENGVRNGGFTTIELNVNAVVLELENQYGHYTGSHIYEYKVIFDSKTDGVRERIKAIEAHPEIGKNPKFFNGNTLILPRELNDLELTIKADDIDDTIVKFEHTKQLEITDPACLRLFNIILNKSFRTMNLFPVRMNNQKSYFDPTSKNNLLKHKLEVWPGYITRYLANLCLFKLNF